MSSKKCEVMEIVEQVTRVGRQEVAVTRVKRDHNELTKSLLGEAYLSRTRAWDSLVMHV